MVKTVLLSCLLALAFSVSAGEEKYGQGIPVCINLSEEDAAENDTVIHHFTKALWDLQKESTIDSMGAFQEFHAAGICQLYTGYFTVDEYLEGAMLSFDGGKNYHNSALVIISFPDIADMQFSAMIMDPSKIGTM